GGAGLSVMGRLTSGTSVPGVQLGNNQTLNASSGTQVVAKVTATINQTSSASYQGLQVAMTETGVVGSTNYLLNLLAGASGTTSKLNVDNAGFVTSASGYNFGGASTVGGNLTITGNL